MSARSDRRLRAVALVLVLAFGANATHAGTIAVQACADECPADCPMHAKHLTCHHSVAPVAAKPHHCHRDNDQGAGLRAAGCAHHVTAMLAADQQAVLPTRCAHNAMLSPVNYDPATDRAPRTVALDPPFHPPAAPPCLLDS